MARRNSKGDAQAPSGGGWEIIYTGFILIMLCFFVMLCSFSKIEKVKMRKFVKSFVHSVDIFQGGFGFQLGGGDNVDTPISGLGLEGSLGPVVRQLVEIRDRFGLQPDITFAISAEGLVLQLSSGALFEHGSADISPKAYPFLDRVAEVIRKSTHHVRVEGHTDNLPIHTKRFPSNWDLSTTRAVNVLRYLTTKGKCPPERLSAAGFGEFQPIFPNDTPEHRAKNRRVEFVFEPE